MEKIKVGAGTTLDFTVPLPEAITEYSNIEVEIFTDKQRPVKFSYVEKTGYNKLNIGDSDLQLTGQVLTADSLKLQGCVFMKLNCFKTVDEKENNGYSVTYGIGRYEIDSNNNYVQKSQLILE